MTETADATPKRRSWRELAQAQSGLVTRAQLRRLGWDAGHVHSNIAAERWVERSSTVIGTTTGELGRTALMWLGALHAGGESLVGDLTAAEVAGLENWHRDDITIVVPQDARFDDDLPGIRFVRTRRPLRTFRRPDLDLPTMRIEPAVLHFAAYQRSRRTAEGVLAAAVQQRLTTAADLHRWVLEMRPLRWSKHFQAVLGEMAGGSQSVAELDVRRMCRTFHLTLPDRQVKRRDSSGRVRYTDCEWRLADGRTLALEVDGSFHMEIEHWEDDIARQRGLTDPDRIVIRCTARELRDEPDRVAQDLRRLGVPRAA